MPHHATPLVPELLAALRGVSYTLIHWLRLSTGSLWHTLREWSSGFDEKVLT